MDVLEYTEQELRAMDKSQLEILLREAEDKESLYNTRQLTEKVLINGLYGATANRHFLLFNEAMAGAITGNGRYFIRKLAHYIENKLQALHKSEKPYIISGDTDSCVGTTLIKTDNDNIQIQDLYDLLSGEIEIKGKNNFIKHVNKPIKIASISQFKKLEFKNIKYVMKHKVKKRMFKIKCNGDEVIVTEDHSIVILRNNTLISVKPKNLTKNDKIIKI